MEKDFDIIDGKYLYERFINEGGFSRVYLIKKEENEYIAKIIKDGKDEKDRKYREKSYDKEVEINLKLSNKELSNIVKFIDNNKNGIMKKNTKTYIIKYLIFEYEYKEDLLKYASYDNGLGDGNVSKYIFNNILKAVQDIHELGIFHLDIKLENILIDQVYNIKLADFGLAELKENTTNGKLNVFRGTYLFAAPQIFQEYDPIKADIFSLGISLFNLVLGELPFKNIKEKEKFFSGKNFNEKEKIEKFWKSHEKKSKKKLSQQFKNLFMDMISYEEEKRPSINKLLLYPWFNDLKKYEQENLEKEARIKLSQISSLINTKLKREKINKENYENIKYRKNEANEKEEFPYGINISKETNKDHFDYYIRIDEEKEVKIVDFMNELYSNLKKNECQLKPNHDNLEFEIIYYAKEYDIDNKDISGDEDSGSESEEENYECCETDEEKIQDNSSIIKNLGIEFKIFKSINSGYILRFDKKEGELIDFYSKLKLLMDYSEKLIYFMIEKKK